MNTVSLRSRIQLGWQFSKISCHFVINNKTTLIFHLIWLAIFGALAAVFCSNLATLSIQAKENSLPNVLILVGIIAVLFLVFVQQLMKVALTIYVSQILQKQKPSVATSIGRACSRCITIFAWAVIDTTVGTVVALLEGKNNDSFVSQIVLSMIGSLVQLAWRILTFFVIPVIALENLSSFDSIKRSGTLMQKTWGQALGAQFGLGFIFILFFLGMYTVIFGSSYLYGYATGMVIPGKTFLPPVIFAVGFLIPLCIALFIGSTIRTVVTTVLYHYAQHKETGPFSAALLQNAFTTTTKQ